MTILSKQEQALSFSAGEVLSDYDHGTLYEGYLEIKRALENNEEPTGVTVWEPLEDISWEHIAELIEKTARVI